MHPQTKTAPSPHASQQVSQNNSFTVLANVTEEELISEAHTSGERSLLEKEAVKEHPEASTTKAQLATVEGLSSSIAIQPSKAELNPKSHAAPPTQPIIDTTLVTSLVSSEPMPKLIIDLYEEPSQLVKSGGLHETQGHKDKAEPLQVAQNTVKPKTMEVNSTGKDRGTGDAHPSKNKRRRRSLEGRIKGDFEELPVESTAAERAGAAFRREERVKSEMEQRSVSEMTPLIGRL
ncbi:hypothetical protein QJS10_CPB21g00784 [Acorus calamus]|uniref:Uncharacterized protein n=1 Tax=Acorus calamus TaxID=4465 RepID=A0AAV9C935_ACOCL|nr:hypothetical protein QJS10_CPB21g00784 [Acorus calamus]